MFHITYFSFRIKNSYHETNFSFEIKINFMKFILYSQIKIHLMKKIFISEIKILSFEMNCKYLFHFKNFKFCFFQNKNK